MTHISFWIAVTLRLLSERRTIEVFAACGETETAIDAKYSTFTFHIDKIARRLSTEESVTVENIARALWPTSYNRVPFFHRVQGSQPIALKPVRPPGQSAQNDPAAQKDLPPVWVVIQVHVTDQLSSNEISELESDIDLIRVREDYKGGITKIAVQHGSIVTFSLPAPIYEWLENDPHFIYQRLAPKESQNISKESTVLERITRHQNGITTTFALVKPAAPIFPTTTTRELSSSIVTDNVTSAKSAQSILRRR